jgi:succinyl-CoA synthetase beta subunit
VNLHEFQSKRLFAGYKIPVPHGIAVETADEARDAANEMGGDRWVVKAQAHTGGRGKAVVWWWRPQLMKWLPKPVVC